LHIIASIDEGLKNSFPASPSGQGGSCLSTAKKQNCSKGVLGGSAAFLFEDAQLSELYCERFFLTGSKLKLT